MRPPRVAIVFDDTVRPDTTGFYCHRAMSCLADTVHFRPADLERVDRRDFDLFISIDDGLRYALPVELRPSIFWAIDTHLDLDWYRERASSFDAVFAAQRAGAIELSRALSREVGWLPLACDPAFHRRHLAEKKWNLAFIGNLFPGPRTDLIRLLQKSFPDVLVDRRFFDDMARAFSESRIIFNRSLRDDINMRVFEATATGSLLLTDDLSAEGLCELFEPGKHLELYRDADELLDKARFYIDRAESRERIAQRGRAHAYLCHTYRRRMEALLKHAAKQFGVAEPIVRRQSLSFRPKAPVADLTSIVILTHNQIEFTRQCLDSIRANTNEPYELIVIDNGSSDGTVEYLEDAPDVILVCNRANRGFPVAANQGMRLARGRSVLLLNNDTVVPIGWLGRLLRALETQSIGLVGPSSNCVSGPQEIATTYRSVAEMYQLASLLAQQNQGVVEDSDRLVGFCLLIDRRVIERIGFLDEGFGLGCFEDDDYTLRARQAGFRTVIARDAFVHHFGSQTFQGSGIDLEDLLRRNQERFRQKWSSHSPSPKIRANVSPAMATGGEPACPKILLLAHVGFLRERLDRSQYLRYLAQQKRGAVLFGPGVANYRAGMSVQEAIQVACNGHRPDWIIHGLDPRASGVAIVRDLATCGIPTAYEFGDSSALREEQAAFINAQRFQIAFAFATRDIPFFRAACASTEVIFLPNAVDTNIFRDYGQPKEIDVLVYGAINPEVYPFRARIAHALERQNALRVHRIVHPDYYPEGGWSNEAVFAGEKLSRAINRSWIAIATQGNLRVFFMKYLEIAASGTAIAGDMPDDGVPFFGTDYIDLSHCRDDAAIIDELTKALGDKDSLTAMTSRARKSACDELSTNQFAARLLQTLSEWGASADQRFASLKPACKVSPLRDGNRASVSLCMIVRDNANTLEPCLASIKPWVDEMVVVDTGSVDETPEIARRHGAKVFHFPWPDSFAAARNESIRHASSEWIFWMDSDDTITPESGRKLKELLRERPPAQVLGYIMQVHCPNEATNEGQDMTVVDHIKLFRNREDLRFEGRIHEQIMPAIRREGGDVVWTDIFVVHSGSDQTVEGRTRKQQRDLRLLRMEDEERPDNSFVLFNIGMTFADMENHTDAVGALERSIEVAEPSESHLRKAYALLAASLSQLERFHDADRVCRSGLALFPSDVELLFRAAMVAHQLGQCERSIEMYREALNAEEVRHHFASVDQGLRGYKTRHNLALVYEDLKQYALAEEQWRLVIAEVPTYRAGWLGLTNNLISQGKFGRAAREAERMLTLGGQVSDAAQIRSQVAQAQGNLAEARAHLERALADDPAKVELLDQLCRLLFEFGSPQEAESRLRELSAFDPHNGSVWHNLGSTYLRLNQYKAAEVAFRKALQFRPNSAASHLYLGFVLEQVGRQTEARACWENAARAAPNDPAAEQARERLAVDRSASSCP